MFSCGTHMYSDDATKLLVQKINLQNNYTGRMLNINSSVEQQSCTYLYYQMPMYTRKCY